jgi:5-methylphenazine-1-carboxylate 1-monooxygenase
VRKILPVPIAARASPADTQADFGAGRAFSAPCLAVALYDRRVDNPVLIVGAGIGGLATALSLDAVGIPVEIYEAVTEVRPLGVGINVLPHAIRELDGLGLLAELAANAVAPSRLLYVTKRGQTIWSEARGRAAGYAWPQLSIHRGTLQQILYTAVISRLGADRVHTSHQLDAIRWEGPSSSNGDVTCTFTDRRSGREVEVTGRALIACDGIHSSARRQLHPHEGMPRWNGALLWRGTVDTEPVLDGRTQIWAGHPRQKFIAYPIADLPDGRQRLNFIAELRTDDTELAEREDWNKSGDLADFLPAFESWVFDWLDVPALLRAAPQTFVFPMVDRDPLERWTHGAMTLLGDAAHPMYPVGSNGASQAILDARVLAACLRDHGSAPDALRAYEAVRRPATSAIVLANRGHGPELPMQLVEERAPDGFSDIAEVISEAEIAEVTDGYRRTAGFALAALSDPLSPSLADASYPPA